MGSSGSQPQTVTQTTQNKDPWSGAVPDLNLALGQAANLFNADVGYQPYAGQTQVALDPWQQTGMTNMANMALQNAGGTPNVLSAQSYLGDLVKNQGLSPELQSMAGTLAGQSNPYLQGVLNQQMDKVNSAMSGGGRYASGSHAAAIAQAIAPTLAQDYMQRQGMAADIYGQGLQRAGQATQVIPSLDQAQYQPMQTLTGLGQFMTDRQQQSLNQTLALLNAQQARPWEQVQRLAAIASGAGGLGGTQVTGVPVNQPSSLQRILGGGLAGAGLGSMFGPVGTGVGAVGGGLLGLL